MPSSQVGFLKGFILTSFDCLVAMFPKLQFTIDNAQNNIKEWIKLQNEKSIKNNRSDINKLNDRIVDAFKSLGGVSQQGTKMNDMLMEKEIRDDVEKMI